MSHPVFNLIIMETNLPSVSYEDIVSFLLSSGITKNQIKSMTVEELENAYVDKISTLLSSVDQDAV